MLNGRSFGMKATKKVTVPKKMTASAAGGLGRLEKGANAPKPGSAGPTNK